MPGFGEFTHTYETRLHERPHWRKANYCPAKAPLGRFADAEAKRSKKDAAKMRDRRFAKSSVFDPDLALRRKRESVLSTAEGIQDEDEKRDYVAAALRQNMDKVDLNSLRSRTGLQLSQSGGALATGMLDLTYNPRAGYSADREKRAVDAVKQKKLDDSIAAAAGVAAGVAARMADRAFHAKHVAASATVHAAACRETKRFKKERSALEKNRQRKKIFGKAMKADHIRSQMRGMVQRDAFRKYKKAMSHSPASTAVSSDQTNMSPEGNTALSSATGLIPTNLFGVSTSM